MVKDVKIGESPEWIKKRIIAAGMRPINNVVDISNFVMLEYGQPTHFFDADKLGSVVEVRDAKDSEEITTLDGVTRTLTPNDIVITDGTRATCIAGVMGGLNTEVDKNTKNIFIEAAIFDAFSITKTSSRLNLKSEASRRYGKGLNFEYTIDAMNRCCELLEKYASGTVLSGEVIHDVVDKTEKVIDVTTSDLNGVLGLSMTDSDVEVQLDKLDFKYELNNGVFHITIPRRRLDVEANKADLAEEIGRLYGYNNLEDTLPIVGTKRGEYIGDVKIRKQTSFRLRTLGLNEVRTYTLVNPTVASQFNWENKENVVLPNPMSIDRSVVRNSLIASLIGTYEYNKSRKVTDVNIYEIAKTYNKDYLEDTKVTMLMSGNYMTNSWNGSVKVDFYLLKGIVENLLDYLGFKNRYYIEASVNPDMHPGISANIVLDREVIGVIGRVHPNISKDDLYVCEMSLSKLYSKTIKPLKFKEVPKYPSMERDMAFVVDCSVSSKEIMDLIKKKGGRLLTNVDVFDVYMGDNVDMGKKSIAFKLTFNDPTKTLTDVEVNTIFENVISEVEKAFNADLRNK